MAGMSRISGKSEKIEKEEGDGSRVAINGNRWRWGIREAGIKGRAGVARRWQTACLKTASG
ncbi:hypothetical protein ACIXIP_07630 [Bacteroides fragilis]